MRDAKRCSVKRSTIVQQEGIYNRFLRHNLTLTFEACVLITFGQTLMLTIWRVIVFLTEEDVPGAECIQPSIVEHTRSG